MEPCAVSTCGYPDQLHPYTASRPVRSPDQGLLVIPKT